MAFELHNGDCLQVMAGMPENSIDTIITDPPYGLAFMGKEWDHGVPGIPFWAEALRVSKPGGILLAFGGTRTVHRLACAIEDAGWEIRDRMQWIYGSGFPKSHNISKAIDKAAGAEREVVGYSKGHRNNAPPTAMVGAPHSGNGSITAPATDAAQLWDGYGTALKPAHEPIIVAMKPLDGTFAQNALTHGVAGLWVDGGRVTGQLPNNKTHDTIDPERGISWADEKNLISTIVSIAESATKAIEQGNRLNFAIENAVSHLSGEQKKTLSDMSKMDISCFVGRLVEAVSESENISTFLSIDTSGKSTTGEMFHQAMLSTISTRTGKIIALKTLSLCHEQTIQDYIGRYTKAMTSAGQLTQNGQGRAAAPSGRWPSNLIHDGSDEVLAGLPDNASRFFYCAKASRSERNAGLDGMEEQKRDASRNTEQPSMNGGSGNPYNRGAQTVTNFHPTVKPLALMSYLARLTKTPTNGTVLDPFMGSGTTGVACVQQGRNFIGIELDADYTEIARRRIEHAEQAQTAERQLSLLEA
jgi:DNA modification methylase